MRGSDEVDHGVTAPVTPSGEARELLRLAWPLVAAQLATVAMGATDAAFLGRLGPTALAAGGLAASIHVTVQIVASGFLSVLAPLFAEAFARRDEPRVASVARHGLLLAGVLSVAAVIGVARAGRALGALGVSGEVVGVVAPFAWAVAWATPFALVSSVFRHLLSATGRPRIVTVSAFVGAGVNLVLDAVLVEPMGPTGVGLATTLAQACACVVLVVATSRRMAISRLLTTPHDRFLLLELLRLGAPVAVMIAAEVAVFQLVGIAIERYGTPALAGHQIGLAVVTTAFVLPLGIAQATAIRVAHGRVVGGSAGARRAGLVGLAAAGGVTTLVVVVVGLAPDLVIHIFTADADTIRAARPLLSVAALFLLFDAAQVVAAGALRGLRDTRVAAAVAVAVYGAVIPVAAVVAASTLSLGVVGIWFALALGLAIVAAALVARFVVLTQLDRGQPPAERGA